MDAKIIGAICVLVGIGVKSLLDFFYKSKSAQRDLQIALKEKRYKVIILLCYALVNYDKEESLLVISRPDLPSKDRLTNELNVEFINMSLFASDSVIIVMKEFLNKRDSSSLNQLAISMRKDLYGISTKLKNHHFDL